MSAYDILIKPLVRRMDLEKASMISLRYFRLVGRLPLGRWLTRCLYRNRPTILQKEVFGIQFNHPIGLGAGLDIHGELYNDLGNLGFSFVEMGPMDAAGIRRALRHLHEDPKHNILAACIATDYLTAFTLAYDFCDFFVVELPEDFSTDQVGPLLDARIAEPVYRPIVLKIPPTLTGNQLEDIVGYCRLNSIDGIETRDLNQLKHIHELSKGRLALIANNHIDTPEQALEALNAGAALIEVRTGLVREGPGIVRRILKRLQKAGDQTQSVTKTSNDETENTIQDCLDA
mgnify:CR=1 FL=1